MNYSEIYKLAAGENKAAFMFLMGWSAYCHAIDDLIDKNEKDYEKFLAVLIQANIIFSAEFYQHNVLTLSPVVQLVTSNYADSLAFAGSGVEWKEKWADTLRFSGNEMVVAVANICGGYQKMREVSRLLREDSWATHHTEDDQPK